MPLGVNQHAWYGAQICHLQKKMSKHFSDNWNWISCLNWYLRPEYNMSSRAPWRHGEDVSCWFNLLTYVLLARYGKLVRKYNFVLRFYASLTFWLEARGTHCTYTLNHFKSILCNIQQFHATLASGDNLYGGRAYLYIYMYITCLPCTKMYHMRSPMTRLGSLLKFSLLRNTQRHKVPPALPLPPLCHHSHLWAPGHGSTWETHASSWTKSCTS